jgi:outer membrane protein OmpA-like peptidoglycan-associated protein
MKRSAGQNRSEKTPEEAARGLAASGFPARVCVVLALLFSALLVPPGAPRAQVTPGGTNVLNTAAAAYTEGAAADSVASNTVVTRVLDAYGLLVSPPGSVVSPAFVLTGNPGDTLYCRLTLDNLANVPDSVAMSRAMLPPTTLPLAAVVFFLDANANARLDPGEDDPAFLSLASGASTPVDVAIVLPAAASGTAHVELRATSALDPGATPASDATVVRVIGQTGTAALHLGPTGNPRALPGGDGSSDDATTVAVGLYDDTMRLAATLENAGNADSVDVFLWPASTLPPGVSFVCTDSSGTPYSPAPQAGRFLLGALSAGELRSVRFVVSSPGTPLRVSLGSAWTLSFAARSHIDTLVVNTTRYDVTVAAAPDPRSMIGLEQTFRQPTASLGDVVTMVVTATNRTDSVRVDQVVVDEDVPPALDFLSGSGVTLSGGGLAWSVGTLQPGESRTTAVKFAVNSREAKGWARVEGNASGRAQTGETARTGPVLAAIRVDNEEVGIEGFLLGDVWIDDDADGVRDAGERGVGNVSVYLESGEYAVTDSAGVFSVPHVFEGRRVVRLDESTLPPGLELVAPPLSDEHAPRPNERLVHLIAPAHARVAFPLAVPAVPPVERTARVLCEERVHVATRPRAYPSFTLPSSQFAFGKTELIRGTESALEPVARFLVEHPDWTALIEGHTDNVPVRPGGQFPSNYELSLARAQSVREVLIGLGTPADQLMARGYGDERPVASNATAEGRSMNRRVDVSFIPPMNGTDAASRIGRAVRDLSVLPDSVRATVQWSFTTTAEHGRSGALRVRVPAGVANPVTRVEVDSVALAENDGEFHFDLERGRVLECRVAFTIVATDTHLVRQVAATLQLDGVEADSTVRAVALHPRDARTSIALSEALAWTELVPADSTDAAATAPPADPADAAPADGPVAIVEPHDGFVATDRDQVAVRVRHPLGTRASLRVNGDPIDEDRIGERTVDVAHQEETTTWYGVHLRGGWNDIVARTVLIDGGVAADTVRVALATKPAEIVPLDARSLIPADGRTATTLRFAVRDGFGLPVMDGFVVTVAEGAELVAAADARAGERGLQATTRDGIVEVPVRARHTTGQGRIALEADGMRAETEIAFVNPDRPLLATGIVDVAMGTYRTRGDGSGHGATNYRDGFDAEAEARAFVQGAAPGGFQVTARVDTRKRYDDPLLKQPDPEKQYPIFGDASSLHYAAPARGGNYLSVDRGQSFLRYADFQTPIDRGEFLTYRQVVTGLTTALVDGPSHVRAFVTQSEFATRTDNLRADGTSGFYYLSSAPIVENSERVIVETRDRFRSEKVLEARVMARRRDYTVNPYDGSILFMEPVSATDRDLNPNYVVVTYETESGAGDSYLFGVRADVARDQRYRAGFTAVANDGDAPGYALYGLDGEARLRGLRVAGEFARSEDDVAGNGNAYKVGLGAERGLSKLDLYLRRVDGDFSNPSFRGADSELASLKAGFEGRLAASGTTALRADGYTHELQRTSEQRETVRATIDHRRRLLEMSAGLRAARHETPADDRRGLLTLVGLGLGNRGRAGIATTWEQNVGDETVEDYPNRVKTTLAVPLAQRFRALATHEYLTASGRPSTHQVTAGIEGTTAGGTQAYTRYALDRAAGDARMGAVSGIRQKLSLGPTTGASVGVETFTSLSGRDEEEYVSLTTGLGSRRPGSYFVDGGYEYRWESAGDKHLLRLSAAQQLGGGFAWLAKNILGLGPRDAAHDATQFYTTLAGSYRSPHAPVQSLLMLKSYYDRYAPLDPEAIGWRLVASTDVNVRPTAAHEVRLKYAYKHVEDFSYAVSRTTDTDLALGQYVWHFGRGWDVDVWGRTVVLRGGGTAQTGYGAEVGRMLYRSVRVGLGYSVNGFDDPDVTGTDAWSEGFGLRIQVILSDWLLSDFERLK